MSSLKEPQKWSSFSDQLELLKKRGMTIPDDDRALYYLERIGYYRLSGYFYSFRQFKVDGSRGDEFEQDSNFNDVLALYLFDKNLRLLALDALERIEIAIRVDVSYLLGKYEPLAHLNREYFKNDNKFEHIKWLSRYYTLLAREAGKNTASKTNQKILAKSFIAHNLDEYGHLPIWASSEVWDFGTLSTLFSGIRDIDSDQIASKYNLISGKNLSSHLRAFNFIRNTSAHHARLWNRSIVGRPSIKFSQAPQWSKLNNEKPFTTFCLIQWMLQNICPNSQWKNRFKANLKTFPNISSANIKQSVSLENFGLPANLDLAQWNLWKD